MKLSQIYSNDERFKAIVFNEKFNLIVGIVKETKSDTHNLGKTSLVTLIDFMLLNQISVDHIFKRCFNFFENHIFYLEILLNNKLYLTIKRGVKEPNKISFKIHSSKTNLLNCEKWDEEDLSLKKAKEYLKDKLSFSVLTEYSYRKFLHYFLKQEKLFDPDFTKNEYGKQENWLPALLDLVGLNSKYYNDKIKLEKNLKELKEKLPEKDLANKIREKETQKRIYEKKLAELKTKTEDFDFYNLEENITQQMSDNVINDISTLNEKKYRLKYDIAKLENSLTTNKNIIDLDELKQLFDEVELYFPDQLKKNYEDLVKFNTQIFRERKTNIEKTLKEKKETLNETNIKLLELEKQQKKYLETLKQKKLYKKILTYQSQIINLEESIKNLSEEIKELQVKENIFKEKTKTEQSLNENINNFKLYLMEKNKLYNAIINQLEDITQNIFDDRVGTFNVELNNANNPKFVLSYINTVTQKFTAEANGETYGEWLDACFDIAILSCYYQKSFYRFLYQDGILESGDNRRKHNFIVEIKDVCEKYNLQYITTGIEHELNSSEVKEVLKEEDTILKLDDRISGEGTLYGFLF